MSELDSLFKLDGSVEILDKTVLEKYASTHDHAATILS
jgi:hypothetical protein